MVNGAIYKITCSANSKFYIGSTKDFCKRKNNHVCLLRKNKHHNIRLQHMVNKYGIGVISFEILEECEYENLQKREQFYLDKYCQDKNMINILKEAYAVNGANHPMFGRKHTKEARLKIKEARAKQVILHSQETKNKIGRSHEGRIINEFTKYKISKSKTGKPSWNKGIKTGIAPANKIKFPESVITEYNSGRSIEYLRNKYDCSWDAVSGFLKENNITTRNISQQKKLTDAGFN